LKPSTGGNMTLGVYTDSICKTEVGSGKIDVEGLASHTNYLTGSNAQAFNEAMEIYKTCRPCRAFKMQDDKNDEQHHRDLGQGYDDNLDDPNDGSFKCDDAAGYTNVNQCMKFKTHTEFATASMYDLEKATMQGGILEITVGGKAYGLSTSNYLESSYGITQEMEQKAQLPVGRIVVGVGSAVCALGFVLLIWTLVWKYQRGRRAQRHLTEPLFQNNTKAID
jgi:hypothetical protein